MAKDWRIVKRRSWWVAGDGEIRGGVKDAYMHGSDRNVKDRPKANVQCRCPAR